MKNNDDNKAYVIVIKSGNNIYYLNKTSVVSKIKYAATYYNIEVAECELKRAIQYNENSEIPFFTKSDEISIKPVEIILI